MSENLGDLIAAACEKQCDAVDAGTEEIIPEAVPHLGNAVNHEKTMRFVQSGFDMQELEVSYGATGTDKPV